MSDAPDGDGSPGGPAPVVAPPVDPSLLDRVRFGDDGLVVAVVQQHETREVLMVAWMDRPARTR